MKTGNCEPITLKRANNNPIVVKNSMNKRFFVSVVHVTDGSMHVFPLTIHRRKCAMLGIEICVMSDEKCENRIGAVAAAAAAIISTQSSRKTHIYVGKYVL